jgi:hypothetical protein
MDLNLLKREALFNYPGITIDEKSRRTIEQGHVVIMYIMIYIKAV